jgi:hypothetical protein
MRCYRITATLALGSIVAGFDDDDVEPGGSNLLLDRGTSPASERNGYENRTHTDG